MLQSILSGSACDSVSGTSRSTRYEQIKNGLWVRPVRISKRRVGYPENEVAALLHARIAGQSDTEIRALVSQLEAARKIPLSAQSPVDSGAQGVRSKRTKALSAHCIPTHQNDGSRSHG